jgi:Ca-activated chloride channel family protein
MLRFAHPEYLWGLVGIPILAIAFYLVQRKKRRALERFIDPTLIPTLAPSVSFVKRFVKQTLVLLSLAFLILAAANPQVGTRLEKVKREGIDLFVALDVSLSMKAEDIRPSRLDKAKRDVSALLQKLEGDRVGLIVFAGDAFVQFPLTADYSAADLFISAVDVESVPTPGTMIGSAIERALESFRDDLPTQKAIIVVSDGENTEGDVDGAIAKAKEANVRIYTIGMGTPEGGPIPMYSGGTRVDYKRDRSGSIVLTKLDETTLQQIALETGGSYRRATSGGNEIDDIFKELSALQKIEMASMEVTGYEDQYQYPLAFALLLLLIEFLLGERKGTLGQKLSRLVPAFRGVILLLAVTSTAEAQTVRSHVSTGNHHYEKRRYAEAEVEYRKALEKNPASREAHFNLGNAQYRQDRFEEAKRAYSAALTGTTAPHEQAAVYHNIGNALFKAGKFKESAEAFKQALRLNPDDDDTRYNYQLAIDRLKNQQNQQQQKQDQKNDQKDQDQQQNQQENQEQKKQDQQNQQQQQPQPQQAKQDQMRQGQQQMPKEQAEQILQALRNNEKELQKQLRKREAVGRARVERDW